MKKIMHKSFYLFKNFINESERVNNDKSGAIGPPEGPKLGS